MPTPIYHSGKNSKAFVGSSTANIELPILGWSVDPSVDIARFRNSKTGSYSVKETTFLDCRFSVTVDHDFAASPYGASGGGLSLAGGGTSAAQLFLSGTSGANWSFPQAILVGNPQNTVIDGKIGTTFNFESSGAWTEPTTSP